MTGALRLTKHHGLGNDFLVALVDEVPGTGSDMARRMCHRREGVGADGLIFATPGRDAGRVGFTLFNSDGSPAEVSGNGLRCFGQALARAREQIELDIVAETPAGERRVQVRPGDDPAEVSVAVEMGRVGGGIDVPGDLVSRLAEHDTFGGLAELRRWASADLGNPHVVFEVAHLGAVELERFGPAVETLLGPINVEVVAVNDRGHIDMRVWERGVGITRACGSGACAAAYVAKGWDLVDKRVEITTSGGTALVDLAGDQAVLTGPATFIATVEVSDG